MLEPFVQDVAAIAPKVAVHVDDIPQTRAEEIRTSHSDQEVEVPANVEVTLYDGDETVIGYHLTGAELCFCKSLMFGASDSSFILFGQDAYPRVAITKVVFYPENN